MKDDILLDQIPVEDWPESVLRSLAATGLPEATAEMTRRGLTL